MTGYSRMDPKLLGQRIRQARESLGLSQEEFANRVDKDQAAISEYENGKRKVAATELSHFAAVLNLPISYFYGDEAEPDDTDRALLAEFHRLPADSRSGAITILRTLADMMGGSRG
jgi:transcriptional regulator with XRE-family HTH domain